jgi:hypothetical protein
LTANLIGDPISVEFSRLAGTFEPIAFLYPGQGTYDQLDLRLTEADVAYLDASGAIRRQVIPLSQETLLSLNPEVVVGDIPTLLDINFDLAQTVHVDLQSNNVAIGEPVIVTLQSNIAGEVGLPSDVRRGRGSIRASSDFLSPDNGGVERLVGIATQVSSSEFTLISGTAQLPLQVEFDNNTVLKQVSPETLDGMIVELEGLTQTSGTLYARELEGLFPATGAEVEGLLYSHSGPEVFTMAPQDGVGMGVDASLSGQLLPVAMSSGMSYSVPWAQEELMGLDLPFDPAHVFPGQRVEFQGSTGLTVGGETALQPYKVELLPQAVTGTMANYAFGETGLPEFDLVLDGDSYVGIMNSGARSVHVYQSSMTNLSRLNGATIENGRVATIRGFLFCADCSSVPTGTPLHLAMVARSVAQLQ